MAEAATSSPDQTENYLCPVCQEILQTPVRTQYCQHVFCRKCFLMAMKSGGAYCPLCRGPVCKRERSTPDRASDIDFEMRRLSGGCMYCRKQVKLYYMKLHYKSCRKYQEEYGISPKNQTIQISPANRTDRCNLQVPTVLRRELEPTELAGPLQQNALL
ncbi:hypothetical protein GDO86_011044 [Hymenochirus boettgeri]|uniref:E3 ubiquitin-protein ligase RNF138 n=1 Tax=Hymenochirus boettgeri TaxID=247094 RepID=A0A8T2JET9_9PIPI|nr:hypothetical protein GDO86_011044 [Hymenochirus boettgeri]